MRGGQVQLSCPAKGPFSLQVVENKRGHFVRPQNCPDLSARGRLNTGNPLFLLHLHRRTVCPHNPGQPLADNSPPLGGVSAVPKQKDA